MTHKYILIFLFFTTTSLTFSQSARDEIFEQDLPALIEEMEFMYGYDQLLREYTIFKSFNKNETDSIELLNDSLRSAIVKDRQFINDTLNTFIFREYINPKDAIHTERMIAITKKYGFPGVERITKYYDKPFKDPEFSPYILLVHAPEPYWEELKLLMKKEMEKGRIDRCTYGHLLWHFTGRKSFQPLLDNGFIMEIKDGRNNLRSTCD